MTCEIGLSSRAAAALCWFSLSWTVIEIIWHVKEKSSWLKNSALSSTPAIEIWCDEVRQAKWPWVCSCSSARKLFKNVKSLSLIILNNAAVLRFLTTAIILEYFILLSVTPPPASCQHSKKFSVVLKVVKLYFRWVMYYQRNCPPPQLTIRQVIKISNRF